MKSLQQGEEFPFRIKKVVKVTSGQPAQTNGSCLPGDAEGTETPPC